MTPRALALLVGLAVAALAGGWYFGTASTPAEQASVASGSLMFPGLAPRLRDAAKVVITHQGTPTVIEKRPDGAWGVAVMHGYPVQDARLRGMLTALTELRLTEARTSDPAEYGRLGVDDPNLATSTADLLQVQDAAGSPIVALIVGHRRVRSQGNVPDQVYVRRPDEARSWLAEGNLQVDADAALWLDRDLMNIGHDRVTAVTVTRIDPEDTSQPLVFGLSDGKFALARPEQHPKLDDYKVDDVARALESMTFQTVRTDADAPGQEIGHSVFTTGDGLAVSVTVLQADKNVWARFAASATGTAQAEASRLNHRLAGWTYQIGAWKEKSLVPTIDDLKAAPPATPAAPEDSPAPPSQASPDPDAK